MAGAKGIGIAAGIYAAEALGGAVMTLGSRRRWAWLITGAVIAVAWTSRGRKTSRAETSSDLCSSATETEGRYDIRRGAAGYSPVIGTFGALAVPAIIVLFTVSRPPGPHEAPLVALAAGLLIVAMIASITGSIGLAAIGAEQDATANLVPATMFLAVAVSVSLVAVLAAFEVLAVIYLPGSKTLFAVITGAAGLAGTFFTALSIADSWHTGPADPAEKRVWQKTQWLKSQQQADRQTLAAIGISSVPAVTGIVLRIAGVHTSPTDADATWLVVAALALALAAVAKGAFRTRHPVAGPQKGLRRGEAYGTTIAISLYALVMMIFLP